MRWNALWMLVLVAGVWGCGLDETYTGMGQGALPGDPLHPSRNEEQTVTCEVECECGGTTTPPATDLVDPLEGRAWRLDSLVLLEPLEQGGFAEVALNGYFAEQIEAETLNIVLYAARDDREAGELELLVGAAVAADGEYSFDASPSTLLAQLYGTQVSTLESASLVVPSDALDPPTLPIQELELTGEFDEAGTVLSNGVLTGALTLEDGQTVNIAGSPLATFLSNSGIDPDLDLDGDGEMDAWLFEFAFGATEVVLGGEVIP